MGKRKRDLLTTIRHEFDKIHESYELLKYKILISCNCSECKDSQSPHFYAWHILNKFIDDKQLTIQCQNSYTMVNVWGLVDDLSPSRSNFSLDYEGNTMSDNSKYNFLNADTVIINEKVLKSEIIGKKYTSDPEIKSSIKEIIQILQRLQTENPNVTESQTKDIIEVKFSEIQQQNPKKWQDLTQQLLNKERWFQGGKAALTTATEHYIDDNIFYKMFLAFLDEFSANH
jgi:hypothetical protein